MSAIAAALIAIAAAGLLAVYLRRPPEIPLRIAAARFLGELTPASRAPIQFARARALLTWRFLLRLALFAVIAAALTVDVSTSVLPARGRIGLRLVIDTSASMAISSGETRAAAAWAAATALIRRVEAMSGDADLCLSVVAVDDQVRPLAIEAVLAGRYDQVTRTAGGPALLAQAAAADDQACSVTHAVVITDRPKVLVLPGTDGRAVLWWQVGRPEGNRALGAITASAEALAGGAVTVRIELSRFGTPAGQPALRVTGPGGEALPATAPDWQATTAATGFVAERPGTYALTLEGGGAFAEDDRAEIDIATIEPVAVDWRLDSIPRPPGLRYGTGPDSVLIAPVAALNEAAGRRAVLILGPLAERAASTRIGAFVEDDALLRDLNLEILDRAAPPAIELPTGFTPVVQEAAPAVSRILIARRARPPAALVPGPGNGSDAVHKAGTVLLFNALALVTADLQPGIDVRRLGADGMAFDDVHWESDSAADGDRSDLDQPIEPRSAGTRAPRQPLWPWLAVVALGLLLADRIVGYRWRAAA